MLISTMRLAVIVFIVAASAGTSRADDLILGTAYQNPWSSWSAYNYKRVESQVRARTKAAVNPSAGAAASSNAAQRPLSATDFKRAGTGRPVLDQYMASTGLTGRQAVELRAAIDAALGQIEAQVRKDNVATSMAVLIAASTYVVRGVELDDPTQDRLTAGLNDVLAADPSFNKLKAADRQLVSDTMMVQAALIVILSAVGDANSKAASNAAARAALKFLTGSETGSVP
jgi:hypothetical protein